MTGGPLGRAAEAAGILARLTAQQTHEAVVILGTGLADTASAIGSPTARIGFDELPGFPREVAPSQRPEIWSLDVGGRRVLVLLGRPHLYEGHDPSQVVHPVRTALHCGCRSVLITNASGAIRPDLRPGDLVLISDHLNLTGVSPLTAMRAPGHGSGEPGCNTADVFLDLTDAWSSALRDTAREIDPSLAEGVYAQLPGPQFETPAEIRMLAGMGADLVGMSSALEAIAARHLGAQVMGLSVVSNMAAGVEAGTMDPGSVVSTAREQSARLGRLLGDVLLRL